MRRTGELGPISYANWAWHHPHAGIGTHEAGEKTPNAWGLYDMGGERTEAVLGLERGLHRRPADRPDRPCFSANQFAEWRRYLCYTVSVNIILFEPHELGKPLPRRDERTLHLLKVLHKKPGEKFDAGILGGNTGTGCIESVRFDGALFYTLDVQKEPPQRYPLRLAVGFPRPIQLRRILRDLSCLGVETIDLIATELGEKSYRDTKMLRDGGAHSALVEGAVQARDTRIPLLSVYGSLDDWLVKRPWDKPAEKPKIISKPGPLLIAADNVRPEGSFARLKTKGAGFDENPALVIALGSERGWSDGERDKLENSGFLRLSMGERPMKTDTACVAAAILALEKIGALE